MTQQTFQCFTGRVAVVTGGSSGIGRATAQRLIKEGMTVYIVAPDETEVRFVAAEMGAHPITADVRSVRDLAAAANTIVAKHGAVDLLMNNAGVGPLDYFDQLTLQDFAWVMETNFHGVLNGLKAFLPTLRRNPTTSWIVNTASLAAYLPSVGTAAYAASKAAVVALSEALSAELAHTDPHIGMTLLNPAPVRTSLGENARQRPGHTVDSPSTKDFLPPFGALDPSEVADMVIESLRQGRKYVFTHPEAWPTISSAHQQLHRAHQDEARVSSDRGGAAGTQ